MKDDIDGSIHVYLKVDNGGNEGVAAQRFQESSNLLQRSLICPTLLMFFDRCGSVEYATTCN